MSLVIDRVREPSYRQGSVALRPGFALVEFLLLLVKGLLDPPAEAVTLTEHAGLQAGQWRTAGIAVFVQRFDSKPLEVTEGGVWVGWGGPCKLNRGGVDPV